MSIQGVRFNLVNPDELRKTFLVESAETWNQNTPVQKGLNDRHLGTSDERYSCLTCGQKSFCPGHEGHIALVKPCFIPNMLDHVTKCLRSVCPSCSMLLIPPEDIKERSLDWISEQVTSHAAYRFCGQKRVDENGDQIGCGTHRSNYTKIDGLHLKGVFYDPIADEDGTTTGGGGEVTTPEDEEEEEKPSKSKRKKSASTRVKKIKFKERAIIVTPEKAHKILQKISSSDAELLGFAKGDQPCWMIWTVIPVIPPPERPTMTVSPQRRGEDDLTYALFNLFKANQDLDRKIKQGCHAGQISPSYELLQFRVATYTTNDLQKQPKVKQRSGRETQGAVQKLKGKEGLVRQNMMGKRVDESARTVITGDPTLSVEELGVPLEIAMVLTKPIPVTADNFDDCWNRVLKGPFEYGGANSIIKFIKGQKRYVDLRLTKDRSEINLQYGMVVEAHIEDGDWILFNRQPTLHRMGMMAHRAKIVPGSTFRLNESVTTPYNADFDGDEMNAHAPQLQATIAENKWLCAVSNHFLSPKNSGATVGLVQDALLSAFLLSLDETFVNREIFFDCVMSMKHGWSRDIPLPVSKDEDGRPVWTGKQLISMSIPKELNIERGKVKIHNGELLSGNLAKGLLGVGDGTLLHLVVQLLGEDRARNFLDNLHDVSLCWIQHKGFTFSLRDISIPDKQRREFHAILEDAEAEAAQYLKQVTNEHGELTVDAGRVETTINQKLNQTISRAAKDVLPSLPRSNLSDMAVGSESKGKKSNITQMVGYVGQQNVYGARIPCGFTGRTLPHFKRNDYGLRSRGWVKHCYEEGLDPQEFFMHAAGGREGLVDTAIKTAKTGYALRQITNAMSDITVDELFRACNSRGTIVQFMYAGDLIDPCKQLSVKMDYGKITKEEFIARYKHTKTKSEKIDIEFQRLEKDRRMIQRLLLLPDGFLESIDDGYIRLPLDIDRIVLDAQVKFSCGKHAPSKKFADGQRMHPDEVIDRVDKLIDTIMNCWAFDEKLQPQRRYAVKMLNLSLRSRLASKRVIEEFQLSRKALEWLCDRCVGDYSLAVVQPGEAVGALAAQSNGEPQQQMTLNTFHFAGISAQNVTLGVPRIKEVIHCSREPKNVTTSLFLDADVTYEQAWFKRGEIMELTVGKALLSHSIVCDPIRDLSDPVQLLHHAIFPSDDNLYSRHALRLEFDSVTLVQHGTSFAAVSAVLREALCDGDTTSCVFSDCDAAEPFAIIRAKFSGSVDSSAAAEQTLLHRFYQQIVEPIRLHGVPGVTSVFIQEDRRQGGLMLDTNGRDMQVLMNVALTQFTRCCCNHPLEVYRTLGVEAARQSIVIEIRKVYRHYGIQVSARHISMIADAMTCAGALMSLDRHGINHGEFNTLAQAAFEELSDVLTRAAVGGKIDRLCDNTSRIMLGRTIRVGTGSFDLFLDRQKHEALSRKFHQKHRERQRQDRRYRDVQSRIKGLSDNRSNRPIPSAVPTFDRVDPMAFVGSAFGFNEDDVFGDTDTSPVTGEDEEAIDRNIGQLWGANLSPKGAGSSVYDPENPGLLVGRDVNGDEYDPASPAFDNTSYDPADAATTNSNNKRVYNPSDIGVDLSKKPALDFGFGGDADDDEW